MLCRNRTPRALAGIAVLLTACLGCSPEGQATAPYSPDAEPRIVSLGLRATRALLVLDLGRHVVAADRASRLALEWSGRPPASVGLADPGSETLLSWRPTLVLTEAQPTLDEASAAALARAGVVSIPVAPHDLDDAYALLHEIATHAGDAPRGDRAVRRIQAPFVAQAARQLGRKRPCVAVVTDLAPLTLAGGHSFATDVLHAVGAESATHGGEAWRRPLSVDALTALAPDLVLVLASSDTRDGDLASLAASLAPAAVRRAELDADALWLDDRETTRTTLETWAGLVEQVRPASRPEQNCGLDPSKRPAPPSTPERTE